MMAFGSCLVLRDWARPQDEAEAPARRSSQPSLATPRGTPSPRSLSGQIRSLVDFGPELDAGKLLDLANQSMRVTISEREEALAALLELSESERGAMLSMLLLGWAEVDPEGATLWGHENLEGRERHNILRDLAATWAHHDATALGTWWAQTMTGKELYGSGPSGISTMIARADPLAFARFMEQPQLHHVTIRGMIQDEMLPGPEKLPELAAGIVGNVDYERGGQQSAFGPPGGVVTSSNPNGESREAEKAAWNELFEKVATAWHRESPEACETWLAQFPEQAQKTARARISRTGQEDSGGVTEPVSPE